MKRNMKKLIVAAAFVLSCVVTANAQQGSRQPQQVPVEQRVEQTTSKVKEHLTLSEAQWEELNTIYTSYYQDMVTMRQQGAARPDRTKMMELQTSRDTKIKSLVGEKNFKKIQEVEGSKRGSGSLGGRRRS